LLPVFKAVHKRLVAEDPNDEAPICGPWRSNFKRVLVEKTIVGEVDMHNVFGYFNQSE
jgi:hypothetical protein